MRSMLAVMVGAAGCAGGEDLPALLDTGWFEDDGPAGCTATLASTLPVEGAVDWYWRDAPRLYVNEAGTFGVRLLEDTGREVAVEVVPDATGLALDVTFAGGLAPDTAHTLEITDCAGVHQVQFTTSDLGLPLDDGARSILRRTYTLDLLGADWVEPGGFGAVLAGLFNTPVLLGVQYADGGWMDWIGTTGTIDVGVIGQDDGVPTWDFPLATFDDAPFFETEADEIRLDIQGFPLPVTDFRLEGTFAADGSRFGGARLVGLGDSRFAGGAVAQPNNPGALCGLASAIGVDCVPCPDGELYCLDVELRNLSAALVPGLVLVPIAGTD